MISIIAAYNNKKVIGKDGKIPWNCSEDLKRFKKLTIQHPVIMGRKTFESIGKTLPERHNIVVTKSLTSGNYGGGEFNLSMVSSLTSAILGCQEYYPGEEIFIIGGEEIYRQAISKADRMYLTHIYDDSDGDAFFPNFEVDDWEVILADHYNDHTFRILERKKK